MAWQIVDQLCAFWLAHLSCQQTVPAYSLVYSPVYSPAYSPSACCQQTALAGSQSVCCIRQSAQQVTHTCLMLAMLKMSQRQRAVYHNWPAVQSRHQTMNVGHAQRLIQATVLGRVKEEYDCEHVLIFYQSCTYYHGILYQSDSHGSITCIILNK